MYNVTGVDPAGAYRGAYHNERTAYNLIKDAGGIVFLVEECCATAGYFPTKIPKHGDVGLVRVGVKQDRDHVVFVATGALCISDTMWAVKPVDGKQIIAQNFPLVKAWTCQKS